MRRSNIPAGPFRPRAGASQSRPVAELIKAREVADRFGCCLRTLRNWERAKILIPERINNRRLYRRDEVDRLLSGEEISETNDPS